MGAAFCLWLLRKGTEVDFYFQFFGLGGNMLSMVAKWFVTFFPTFNPHFVTFFRTFCRYHPVTALETGKIPKNPSLLPQKML